MDSGGTELFSGGFVQLRGKSGADGKVIMGKGGGEGALFHSSPSLLRETLFDIHTSLSSGGASPPLSAPLISWLFVGDQQGWAQFCGEFSTGTLQSWETDCGFL